MSGFLTKLGRSMSEQYEKKITWTVKSFSFLQSEKIYSDQFIVGGCKWRLLAYPKGYDQDANYLFLFLNVADSETLPSGWRRRTKFRLTISNQLSGKHFQVREAQLWFDQKDPNFECLVSLPVTKLLNKNCGFLMNDEIKIVVEVDVLEVIGKSDVLEETSPVIDVNGFQVLPSQVKSVNRLFERHPNIASKLHIKNQHLKSGCMNALLSLTDSLCRSPKEISKDDLSDAEADLAYMANAGFELDWLEKKLDQVKERKEKEEAGEIRVRKIEQELKDLKHKCSDLEALLEKEKAEILATRAHLSLSDDDAV